MSFEINKDLAWVGKAFGRNPNFRQNNELPGLVIGRVTPEFDAIGWGRYAEEQYGSTAGVNVATVLAPINDTENNRLYTKFSGFHDDPGFTHQLQIFFQTPTAGLIAVSLTQVLNANAHNVGFAGVLIPPRGRLRIESLDAVGAGNTLQINWAFIEIPQGEYVPPLAT